MFASTTRHQVPFGLVILGLLVATGCSSGGSGSGVLQPPAAGTEQRATAVMQQIVLPTLEQLGFDAGRSNQAPPLAALGDGCIGIEDVCTSGSFEWCISTGVLSWRYQSCDGPTGIVDGSWSLDFDNGVTAVYDLRVDELDLTGAVSWTFAGACVTHDLDQFNASRPGASATLDGALTYCPNEDPTGLLELLAADEESSFRMTLELNENGATVRIEFENSSETCTVDLGSGDVECL